MSYFNDSQDTKDFMVAYEDMLQFLQDTNWPDVANELSAKGVKAMTFYDVVLDYILMDAFEDLDMPPQSVTAVIQNRWLSNGFKESVSFIYRFRSVIAVIQNRWLSNDFKESVSFIFMLSMELHNF